MSVQQKGLLALFTTILWVGSAVGQWPTFTPDVLDTIQERKAEMFRYRQIQLAEAKQTPNQERYDVIYYGIDLTINPTQEKVMGTVQLRAGVVDDPIDHMEVDLLGNMTVSQVTVSGATTSFTHQNNLIDIDLDSSYTSGEIIDVAIEYSGNPAASGLGSFGFDSHAGKPMIWSLSEPYGARNWWPCKDQPVDKADSVDIRVTVPKGMIVASNGSLREVMDNGDTETYWWHEGYPIVTYLVSVAIYEYAIYSDYFKYSPTDSMEIKFFVFPDHLGDVQTNYAKTKDMLGIFSDLFGPYPFIEEKYGHAEFVWGGGMEHQTCTSLGGWSEVLIAHELAHQWWGDMITCRDFHHIWLNEGFATYSEALYWEQVAGKEAYFNDMNRKQYFGDGTIYVPDPSNVGRIFHRGLSYHKASWVLHMLRNVVGDSTFFDILQAYYDSEYRHGTAVTEDFQAICESVSGMELNWFFQEWIYQAGHPQYEFLWTSQESDSGYLVDAYIRQVQTRFSLFKMPVDIWVTTSPDSVTTERVMVDGEKEHFQTLVFTEPTDVQLDKENWVLKKVTNITTPIVSSVGYTVDDEAGNGNGRPDPGEEVELTVKLFNGGVPAHNLTGTIWTKSSYINITDAQGAFGSVGVEDSVENKADPFGFEVDPLSPNHTALFLLELNADGGYQKTGSLYVEIGPSTVLLVDDDGGANYESYYEASLSRLVPYDLWETAQRRGPPGDTLGHYQAVIWLTGNDSLSSLTSAEQEDISNYLDDGGNLFLSGQDIGYDLVEGGDATDSAFYHQVLCSEYGGQVQGRDMLCGVTGDPITDGVISNLNGDGGADNQRHPDVVSPLSEAVTIFRYYPSDSPESAAIRYAGSYRLVYFGFGFEALTGDTPEQSLVARTGLLNRILGWFGVATEVEETRESRSIPSDYSLFQNYPNPFNSTTLIRYQLSAISGPRSAVSLKIYNVLGREVRTLVNGEKGPGDYAVVWNGKDNQGKGVSSGVYFCRFRKGNLSQIRKMVLLK